MTKMEVKIDTIREFGNDLNVISGRIEDNLLLIKNQMLSLEADLDTPTGNMLKNKIINYVDDRMKYIEEDIKVFSTKINNIADIYASTQESICASINGER